VDLSAAHIRRLVPLVQRQRGGVVAIPLHPRAAARRARHGLRGRAECVHCGCVGKIRRPEHGGERGRQDPRQRQLPCVSDQRVDHCAGGGTRRHVQPSARLPPVHLLLLPHRLPQRLHGETLHRQHGLLGAVCCHAGRH
jgi:hypothetical protein